MMRLYIYSFFFFYTVSTFGQNIVQGSLLAHWSSEEIPGSATFDNPYNEVWGLSVNGHEYAIIGSTLGTHFIDVTNTNNIFEAFFVEGRESGTSIIHRDYHDNDGFLYAVADEGESSLQIIDIRSLPAEISVVHDSNEIIMRSHNIFIDEDNDLLYSCSHIDFLTGYSALRIIDVSDPFNPQNLIGTNSFEAFELTSVHDAYVKDNIAYLNCGFDGFAIVDMNKLDDMKLLSLLEPDDYPQSGYNHSGWLSDEEEFYYMADETHGRALKAIDVRDKNDLETKSIFDLGEDIPNAIPHNLIVKGNYLYVSYYFNGLQVFDITDRERPVRVMHYPTSSIVNNNSYAGAWGVYPLLPSGNILISDMQEGLFVVEDYKPLVSTNNILEIGVKIYPNPASSFIQIELESPEAYKFAIKDISGRILKQGEISRPNYSLNIDDLASGIYFFEISNRNEQLAQKFVVSK